MRENTEAIEVKGGAIPTSLMAPEDPSGVPALVVIPSIFGVAPDLLRRLSELADRALIAVPDPFWRLGGGVVPYSDHEGAISRLKGFEMDRCIADLDSVVDWVKARSNGHVIGLGICFGGPFALRFASNQRVDGIVTWHGSRMEGHLERASEITCPVRMHFGSADPVTPPDVIETISSAFSSHPDLSIVVHPGAVHGFSHDGAAYDEVACQAGIEAVEELIERF